MNKCIICDIDGTLVEQHENYIDRVAKGIPAEILPGTLDKLKEWEKKGYRLILITARKESSRRITEESLTRLGIFYDQLVMGVGTGPRVIINDLKPDMSDMTMAVAVNIKRNEGIGNLDI